MEKREKELCRLALEAREQAYCPYSGFAVGAALLCDDGKMYTGCNIESSSYSPSICAERVAFAKTVSEGERDFVAIAVAGANRGEMPKTECPPCGVCRQVMAEFCDFEKFIVLMVKSKNEYTKCTLKELFPWAFGVENLQKGD